MIHAVGQKIEQFRARGAHDFPGKDGSVHRREFGPALAVQDRLPDPDVRTAQIEDEQAPLLRSPGTAGKGGKHTERAGLPGEAPAHLLMEIPDDRSGVVPANQEFIPQPREEALRAMIRTSIHRKVSPTAWPWQAPDLSVSVNVCPSLHGGRQTFRYAPVRLSSIGPSSTTSCRFRSS